MIMADPRDKNLRKYNLNSIQSLFPGTFIYRYWIFHYFHMNIFYKNK